MSSCIRAISLGHFLHWDFLPDFDEALPLLLFLLAPPPSRLPASSPSLECRLPPPSPPPWVSASIFVGPALQYDIVVSVSSLKPHARVFALKEFQSEDWRFGFKRGAGIFHEVETAAGDPDPAMMSVERQKVSHHHERFLAKGRTKSRRLHYACQRAIPETCAAAQFTPYNHPKRRKVPSRNGFSPGKKLERYVSLPGAAAPGAGTYGVQGTMRYLVRHWDDRGFKHARQKHIPDGHVRLRSRSRTPFGLPHVPRYASRSEQPCKAPPQFHLFR